MTAWVLILAFFYPGSGWAADKEVEVHTSHFADKELEQRTAMDEKAQSAAKAWLQLPETKCEFVSPDYVVGARHRSGRPALPEIFEMQVNNCDSKGANSHSVSYCGARVVCENPRIRYLIRDVYCRAVSAKSCPGAKDCALATHLTRSLVNDFGVQSDGKKQTAVLQQDIRGWDPDHTNRYSWTQVDQEELEKAIKDQNVDKGRADTEEEN